MLFYTIGFGIAAIMPTLFGYMGFLYIAIASLLGISWSWLCIQGFKSENDVLWARRMFLSSLVIITSICSLFFFEGVL